LRLMLASLSMIDGALALLNAGADSSLKHESGAMPIRSSCRQQLPWRSSGSS
jgi:hypothetical protein